MDRPTADIHEPYILTDELVKLGWNREHLTCGDFIIPTYEGKVAGIERKEASDLLNSMSGHLNSKGQKKPGRLGTQLQNLLNTYDYPFLLTEGNIGEAILESNWNVEAVRNFLLTWQLKGIILIRTSDNEDTISRLLSLVVYFSRPLHLGGLNKRALGDERLMAFPSCIPIKQREALLNSYSNIITIASMARYTSNLEMFDGIGKVRAEALHNFFYKENNK